MSISKTKRLGIFARDQLRCRYCLRICTIMSDPYHQPPETATLDHLDPAGGDEEWNLVTACKRCNSRKHARTVTQFEDFLMDRFDWSETRL